MRPNSGLVVCRGCRTVVDIDWNAHSTGVDFRGLEIWWCQECCPECAEPETVTPLGDTDIHECT